MGRTACTEPQCLYSRVIPLLPLWVVRPVQSLSVYTRVHFIFYLFPLPTKHKVHKMNIQFTDKRGRMEDITYMDLREVG
jgi:hypothetical protein